MMPGHVVCRYAHCVPSLEAGWAGIPSIPTSSALPANYPQILGTAQLSRCMRGHAADSVVP